MEHQTVQQYVIVGGGTAGWMTAALLGKVLRHTGARITLVESPEQDSVGVGEATVPSFVDFIHLLGINEREFVRETGATFKLGIRFTDWLRAGHQYWHPFGNVGARIDGQGFFQQWLKAREAGLAQPFTDFSPAARMAEAGRFYIPDPAKPNNLSRMGYALHFDSKRVADYLGQFAQRCGVVHRRAHVEDIKLDEQHNIRALTLRDGEEIPGDFFIDCSGARARLLGQALQVDFVSWQQYLPVNAAVVVQSPTTGSLPPFTEAYAEPEGWRWRIPLQQRFGNGLVFCDHYCTPQQAESRLLSSLGEKPLHEPRLLRFETGRRQRFWKNNCVAIGLSSGFLEPLESTGIYLIMRGILNLAKLLPSVPNCEATIDEYNRLMGMEYDNIRDFIVLHYTTAQRQDSEFWRSWQKRPIPASLARKLALYNTHGVLEHNDLDLFASDSWHAVLTGMEVLPRGYDPVLQGTDSQALLELLQRIDYSLAHSVSQLPPHDGFIARITSK